MTSSKARMPLADRLLDQLAADRPARTAELASRVGAASMAVRHELMRLEREGKVRRTGHTRGTRWWRVDGEDPPPPPRGPKEVRLDERVGDLGRLPDGVIAEQVGVSVNTVRNYRKRHGLAAFSAMAVPARQALWEVDLADGADVVRRYVRAADIVDAAAVAARAGVSRVVAIRRVEHLDADGP